MNRVLLFNGLGQCKAVLREAKVQCSSSLSEVGRATIETTEIDVNLINELCSGPDTTVYILYAIDSFASEPRFVIWSGFITGTTVRRALPTTTITLQAVSSEDILRRRIVLFPKDTAPDNAYRWYENGTSINTIVNGLLRNYQSDTTRYFSNPFPFVITPDVASPITVPEIDTGEKTPYDVLRTIINRYGTYFKVLSSQPTAYTLVVRTLMNHPDVELVLTPSSPFVVEYNEEWLAADDGALAVWYGGSSVPYQAASSYFNSARERLFRANTTNQGEATFEAVTSFDPYPTKQRYISVELKGLIPKPALITGTGVAVRNEFGFGRNMMIRSVVYRSDDSGETALIELTNKL